MRIVRALPFVDKGEPCAHSIDIFEWAPELLLLHDDPAIMLTAVAAPRPLRWRGGAEFRDTRDSRYRWYEGLIPYEAPLFVCFLGR